MGVSIYYRASRATPLSPSELMAIDEVQSRYPVEALIGECRISEADFDGEEFCVYVDGCSEPGVVFEGATKLPLCSEEAMWAALQYWCKLLSDVRHLVIDCVWSVEVDGHDVVWVEELQAFDPSV
jgi:hypothetical protein